jgi:hypothetical protein
VPRDFSGSPILRSNNYLRNPIFVVLPLSYKQGNYDRNMSARPAVAYFHSVKPTAFGLYLISCYLQKFLFCSINYVEARYQAVTPSRNKARGWNRSQDRDNSLSSISRVWLARSSSYPANSSAIVYIYIYIYMYMKWPKRSRPVSLLAWP